MHGAAGNGKQLAGIGQIDGPIGGFGGGDPTSLQQCPVFVQGGFHGERAAIAHSQGMSKGGVGDIRWFSTGRQPLEAGGQAAVVSD